MLKILQCEGLINSKICFLNIEYKGELRYLHLICYDKLNFMFNFYQKCIFRVSCKMCCQYFKNLVEEIRWSIALLSCKTTVTILRNHVLDFIDSKSSFW